MVSFDEMFEMRDSMTDQIVDGPTANSTPFHKRISRTKLRPSSISDEFKGIVMHKDPSPFCEKSVLHNESGASQLVLEKVDCGTQTMQYRLPIEDFIDLKSLFYGTLSSVFLAFLAFTFFGAIEISDGRKLMPILWSPYFPEPFAMVSVQFDQDSVW